MLVWFKLKHFLNPTINCSHRSSANVNPKEVVTKTNLTNFYHLSKDLGV